MTKSSSSEKRIPRALSGVRKNPHIVLAVLLFLIGIIFLRTSIPTVSGALFGAGASLLGAWITELNSRRSESEDKTTREIEARKYLAPELNRTIERVLYIHERAIPNFSSASVDYFVEKGRVKPNDLKEDFIPHMPLLFPKVPQFRDLNGIDATALIAFYDSLYNLEKFVSEWWAREGQLPVNIFNMILTKSGESLCLAEVCINLFGLEESFPPRLESWGTLSSRISKSKQSAKSTLDAHLVRANKKSQD